MQRHADKTVKLTVPATIGNIGPGFDVLGLAVEGLGDVYQCSPSTSGHHEVVVTGRDADAVPTEFAKNCFFVAAEALMQRAQQFVPLRVHIQRQLPLAGGLGASAAASVAGAMLSNRFVDHPQSTSAEIEAALVGEAAVAGAHLDNIAPAYFGGVTLIRSVRDRDIIPIEVKGEWWLAVVSPAMRLATREARAVLPTSLPTATWVEQMAHTACLITAFHKGDHQLAARSLRDVFAEPHRQALIPRFAEVKAAALRAGALGCSISGAGPSIFALAATQAAATSAAEAMTAAFVPMTTTSHVGRMARQGARVEVSS